MAEKQSLVFPNLKQVFGEDSYNLRIAVAQVLHKKGVAMFPSNSYVSEKMSPDFTTYIGEPKQNEAMRKLPVELLQSIKTDAIKCNKDFSKCSALPVAQPLLP